MADGFHARFHGIAEFDRALGKADKDLRKGLRDDLRGAAEVVAIKARDIARSKHLVDSGDLVRGIQPYALTGKAGVRSNARHRGFAYPNVLEFQGRGTEGYGPDASLYPALTASEIEVRKRLDGVLDKVVDDITRG